MDQPSLSRQKKVAVIGAGPCGIGTAKWLLAEGFNVQIFEQRSELGGLWAFEQAVGHSPCYQSLVTNTPKRMMQYEEDPMPSEFPTYPHWSQVKAYLDDYAQKNHITPRISFETTVHKIQHADNVWKIEHQQKGDKEVSSFDAVAVCTGHHWYPSTPAVKDVQNFKGKIVHSREYKDPKFCEGKRVLVVGLGVSANELLKEIGDPKVNATVSLSTRRFGQSLESLGPTVHLFDLYPMISCITEDGQVKFQNEAIIEVDIIIFCTGYSIHLPFISQEIVPVEENGSMLSLYKQFLVPKYPTLALIGFVTTFGSLHPIGAVQGRAFARILAKKIDLPSTQEMIEQVEEWKASIHLNRLLPNHKATRGGDRLPDSQVSTGESINTLSPTLLPNAHDPVLTFSPVIYRPMNVDYYSYIGELTSFLKLPKSFIRKPNHLDNANLKRVKPTPPIQAPGIVARHTNPCLEPREENGAVRQATEFKLAVNKTKLILPPASDEPEVLVAAIQASSELGNVDKNIQKFDKLAREAATKGAKFIVFPEAAITGYTSQDLNETWLVTGRKLANRSLMIAESTQQFQGRDLNTNFAETVPGKATDHFCALAKELNVYLVVPFIEYVPRLSVPSETSFIPATYPNIYYNSCVLCSPQGEIVAHYRKNNLWGFIDHGWCTAGSDAVTYQTEYGRVGLAICFDHHVMLERYSHYDLWTLLYPIAWVDPDSHSWYNIDLPERIGGYGYNLVGANWSVDEKQNWVGYGYSRVINHEGKVVAHAETDIGSEIVYAKLPTKPIRPKREELTDCVSSDLLDASTDPNWSRRTKSHDIRFNSVYTYQRDDGLQIHLHQSGDETKLGATVWDGGIVLSKYLEWQTNKGTLEPKGKKFLELGSGTGLTGLVAASLGAQTLLTDIEGQVPLLSQNLTTNSSQVGRRATVLALDWTVPVTPQVKGWIRSGVDYIIASDVIYADELVESLVSTLYSVSTPNTIILLSYEMHKLSPLVSFFQEARKYFDVDAIPNDEFHPEYRLGGVNLKVLRKKAMNPNPSNPEEKASQPTEAIQAKPTWADAMGKQIANMPSLGLLAAKQLLQEKRNKLLEQLALVEQEERTLNLEISRRGLDQTRPEQETDDKVAVPGHVENVDLVLMLEEFLGARPTPEQLTTILPNLFGNR